MDRHKDLVDQGLVQALTSLAQSGARSLSFDINCSATLRNLSRDDANLEAIITTRGTVRLCVELATAATASKNAETQGHSCIILYNLTKVGTVR